MSDGKIWAVLAFAFATLFSITGYLLNRVASQQEHIKYLECSTLPDQPPHWCKCPRDLCRVP